MKPPKPAFELLGTAVDRDYELAQEALDGAKKADELLKKAPDEETRKGLLDLKDRFLKISDNASANASVTHSLGQSFIKSSSS